jgi:hypothetical protein
MHRRKRNRASAIGAGAVAALALGLECTGGSINVNRYCVFEGRIAVVESGCPSLCGWQCIVAAEGHCERAGCVELCALERLDLTEACVSRAQTEWSCLREEADMSVTCRDGEPMVFSVRGGSCLDESAARERECAAWNPFALGPAPPLCEWQCALAAATECSRDDCLEACQSRSAGQDSRCRQALLAQWSCMADSGRETTTCHDDVIVFPRSEGTCRVESDAAREACRVEDPLLIRLDGWHVGGASEGSPTSETGASDASAP